MKTWLKGSLKEAVHILVIGIIGGPFIFGLFEVVDMFKAYPRLLVLLIAACLPLGLLCEALSRIGKKRQS